MSMFTQFNGPQSLSGASTKDILALVNAYTELATELHEHMQKTVGFAESSDTETSTVTGFVHGIQEVINKIQSTLSGKAALTDFNALSTNFGTASKNLDELMEHIYASGGESSIDHKVGVLESAKDDLSERTETLEGSVKDIDTSLNGGDGEDGIIKTLADLGTLVDTLKEHAELLAAEETGDVTATFEKVVSSAKYLLGTLYAKKYIDFTCWQTVSAQFAGTGTTEDTATSGLYLLGKMSTNWEDDDDPIELPKPCRVYVKYNNTKQMDAIIDAIVSDGKGSIQAIVSKSEGLFDDLRFHVIHGTTVGGKASTYIALSTSSLGGISTLNVRVAGVNFIPLDADGVARTHTVTDNYASTSSMSESMTSAVLTSSPQIFSTLALDELTDTEGRTIFKVVQPEGTSEKVLEIGSDEFSQVQFLKRPTVQNDNGERHAFVTDEDVDRLAALPVGTIIQWPTFEEVMEGDTVTMRRATNVPSGWHATDGSTITVEGNEAIAEKGLLQFTNDLKTDMVLPLQDFSIIKTAVATLDNVLADVDSALDLEVVNNRIDDVISDYKEADNNLLTKIQSNTTLIEKNSTAISEEAETRASKDDELSGRLDTAEGNISTLQTGLAEEAGTRESQDATLSGRIDTAEDNISTLQTGLSEEADTRASQDAALSGRIDTLQTNLDNEADLRASQDAALSGRLTTAEDNISTLQTNLSEEQSQRASEDADIRQKLDEKTSELASAIEDETTRATESERAVEQSVNAAKSELEDAIASEASDRKTADSALINFLQDKVVYANRDELPNVTPDADGHEWQTGDTAVIFTGTSIVQVVADVTDSIVTWH